MIIHWNVEPEIFRIGSFALRYYSLMFGLAFLSNYLLLEKIFKKEHKPIILLDDLLMYIFIAVVVGSRLAHCIFYGYDETLGYNIYFHDPIQIFKVWEGGLASHGALVGIVLAVYLFVRKHKEVTFFWVIDRICIVAALACCFIRIGNFFNSEIVGKYTDGSWGIVFEQLGETAPRIPVMLFESISYLIFFFWAIHYYYKKEGKLVPGKMLAIFFIVMLTIRFFWEFFKESEIIFMGMNHGQLLSIPIIIAGFILYFYVNKRNAVA